ncbi:hypothetical protein KDW_55590 [Dictyobacter vulcani]|uniref:DUF1963 domain-containing protein n=1 Tax=Dictyobacter vulcani TaxID=2607529 RepID=A0A5J4KXW4_9CHLR|nr:YwqG family protein [Dictyobacter vulcani]GER91397.1 hypothetical protein KDW_55590 [Dictyobacter vulcani]
MNKKALHDALVAAGLSRLLKDLPALLAPSIHLIATPTPEAALASGSSKIGGIPDLPPDVAWPRWRRFPLAFIAQLRLAELAPYDSEHSLPAYGMLWFFYAARQQTYGADPDDLGSWSVLYRRTTTHLQPRLPPESLPCADRFSACQVHGANDSTLSQLPQSLIKNFDWSDDEQERYDELVSSLSAGTGKYEPHHSVLGHPYMLQDDMQEQCQLMRSGVRNVEDPRIELLCTRSRDWRLLLQLDSDERIHMRWGSSGMLYYWIRWPDLQAGYFADTWLILQSD